MGIRPRPKNKPKKKKIGKEKAKKIFWRRRRRLAPLPPWPRRRDFSVFSKVASACGRLYVKYLAYFMTALGITLYFLAMPIRSTATATSATPSPSPALATAKVFQCSRKNKKKTPLRIMPLKRRRLLLPLPVPSLPLLLPPKYLAIPAIRNCRRLLVSLNVQGAHKIHFETKASLISSRSLMAWERLRLSQKKLCNFWRENEAKYGESWLRTPFWIS